MNPRLQSALVVVMVACILAIVYSPFVDLPLTDTRANHNPVQHVQLMAASAITVIDTAQGWFQSAPPEVTALATDVVAITCAYLC